MINSNSEIESGKNAHMFYLHRSAYSKIMKRILSVNSVAGHINQFRIILSVEIRK